MSTLAVQSPSRIELIARDIKLSHSVFALPWALLSAFLAARGLPKLGVLGLILICMVTARTVAMGMNRLLDARLDKLNPRTAGRALPAGRITATFYALMVAECAACFILATAGFWWLYRNPLPLLCSVPVLLFLSAYPFLKRFTRFCHYYLGAALALAPVCAWVAVTAHLSIIPLLLAAAVLLWTAGFDIIYACQDYQSDLVTGVVSIPARVGIANALWIARISHLFSFAAMISTGLCAPQLSVFYFIGVGCAGLLLVVEHSLVKPNDLSKVGLAFFTINGVISLLIGSMGIIDVLRTH